MLTSLHAGSGHGINDPSARHMTQRGDPIRNIRVIAAITDVGGVAVLSTGRRKHLRIVGMSPLACQDLTADCTDPIVGAIRVRAGRVTCLMGKDIVKAIPTTSAGERGIATLGTGRRCDDGIIRVTKTGFQHRPASRTDLTIGTGGRCAGGVSRCMDDGIHINVPATQAGMGGVTVGQAGRHRDLRFIGVTRSVYQNSITSRTDLVIGAVGICAGDMSGCMGMCIGIAVPATGTGMDRISSLGTGRRGHGGIVAMTHGISQDHSADGTGLAIDAIGRHARSMPRCGEIHVDIAVTATSTGKGGIAVLGTGRRGHDGIVVVPHFVYQHLAATQAGLVVGAIGGHAGRMAHCLGVRLDLNMIATGAGTRDITALGTSGGCYNGIIRMTPAICQNLAAYRTDLVVVAIRDRAGGMSDRIGELIRIAIAATDAGIGGIATVGTGRRGYDGTVSMSQSALQHLSADRTGLVVVAIRSRTGGMTGRVGEGIRIAVPATGTGIGGIAAVGTGRRGYDGTVSMSQSALQHLSADRTGLVVVAIRSRAGGMTLGICGGIGEDVAATGTGMGGVATVGTGRRGYGHGVIMAQGLDQHVTADQTDPAVDAIRGRTGGMTQRCHEPIGIAVRASGTGMDGVACTHTGGIGGNGAVIMTQSAHQHLAADRTSLIVGTIRPITGGMAVLCTAVDPLVNTIRGKIHGGGCGNGIHNPVAVYIVALEEIVVQVIGQVLAVGLTDHPEGGQDLGSKDASIGIQEGRGDPFITVND